jgi:GrpB-like predicted nucleotidyltransferase (UPF0157 family)
MGAQQEAEVHVVPYDASWPERFASERALLLRVISQYACGPVEHIGSTAVPGLVAKPVIDIMVAVASLAVSQPAIELLEESGYSYAPYRPDVMHWLCKPSAQSRTHHLHLVPFRGSLWNERIAFRDYLRTSRAAAAEYAELKIRLARRFKFDREAYTDAKEPFVRRIVGLALESQPLASG